MYHDFAKTNFLNSDNNLSFSIFVYVIRGIVSHKYKRKYEFNKPHILIKDLPCCIVCQYPVLQKYVETYIVFCN